jgi:hypothetical protein
MYSVQGDSKGSTWKGRFDDPSSNNKNNKQGSRQKDSKTSQKDSKSSQKDSKKSQKATNAQANGQKQNQKNVPRGLYDILGVKPGCSKAELTQSYKALVLQYKELARGEGKGAPQGEDVYDKRQAEAKVKEIESAYNTLLRFMS